MSKTMFFALAVVSMMALTVAKSPLASFEEWRISHNKVYPANDEYMKRARIFSDNLERIKLHNARNDVTYTMALNSYADQTWTEFRMTKLGGTKKSWKVAKNPINLAGTFSVPDEVDWVKEGKITEVKNQGQCGSCWSFSTTGAVECAHAIATGELVSLSEQQLVDCAGSYGNYGCNGGLMDDAFQYIEKTGFLCTERSYPYLAYDDTCSSDSCTDKIQNLVTSFQDVAQYNEDALKAAVSLTAVSVAIEADQEDFQFYSGGVFNSECGTSLDHGVLAVGYGTENGQDYWKIKNSWGRDWGDAGYIKIARGTGSGNPGLCGIAIQPSYPICKKA